MEAYAYNPSIGSVGQKIREVEGRMKEIEGEGDRQHTGDSDPGVFADRQVVELRKPVV